MFSLERGLQEISLSTMICVQYNNSNCVIISRQSRRCCVNVGDKFEKRKECGHAG